MTRLIMPSAMPAELAEKLSDVDDGYTPAEEAEIERRVEEIINERVAHGDITDLLDGIDYIAYAPELQRACRNIWLAMNLHDELKGSAPHLTAVFSSILSIRHTLLIEARRIWGEEAREQAEKELSDGKA